MKETTCHRETKAHWLFVFGIYFVCVSVKLHTAFILPIFMDDFLHDTVNLSIECQSAIFVNLVLKSFESLIRSFFVFNLKRQMEHAELFYVLDQTNKSNLHPIKWTMHLCYQMRLRDKTGFLHENLDFRKQIIIFASLSSILSQIVSDYNPFSEITNRHKYFEKFHFANKNYSLANVYAHQNDLDTKLATTMTTTTTTMMAAFWVRQLLPPINVHDHGYYSLSIIIINMRAVFQMQWIWKSTNNWNKQQLCQSDGRI